MKARFFEGVRPSLTYTVPSVIKRWKAFESTDPSYFVGGIGFEDIHLQCLLSFAHFLLARRERPLSLHPLLRLHARLRCRRPSEDVDEDEESESSDLLSAIEDEDISESKDSSGLEDDEDELSELPTRSTPFTVSALTQCHSGSICSTSSIACNVVRRSLHFVGRTTALFTKAPTGSARLKRLVVPSPSDEVSCFSSAHSLIHLSWSPGSPFLQRQTFAGVLDAPEALRLPMLKLAMTIAFSAPNRSGCASTLGRPSRIPAQRTGLQDRPHLQKSRCCPISDSRPCPSTDGPSPRDELLGS